MNPIWIGAFGSFAGVIVGFLVWAGRRSWNFLRLIYQFLTDWNGTPADTRGHEARPGVMQRLGQLEHNMLDVQGQVHMNGGGSLRDEVKRTEAAVETLTDKVNDLADSVDELKAR